MRRIGWVTTGAVLAAVGVTVALTLMHLEEQQPIAHGPAPGMPLLREIHLAGQHLPVLVTPRRPGANLVLVGGESSGVRVGAGPDTLDAAVDRPGTTGKWAQVDLPPGAGVIWLELGGQRTAIDVDAGHGEPAPVASTGPDGPECASAALAGALAEQPRAIGSCPADSLAAADESSLRALVGFLAGRGVRALTIAGDNSARSAAAAAAVREAAARRQLTVSAEPGVDNALVVVSGWAAANGTLTTLAQEQRGTVTFSAGTYLAPWLLTAPVLATTAGAVLPLRFDPRDEQPVRYQVALATRFHGQSPTASGYLAFRAGSPATETTRLYAATRVAFMPAELGAHQHGHNAGWLPGGTIVAVTGNLT